MLRYLRSVITTLRQAVNIVWWFYLPIELRWWVSDQTCCRDWRIDAASSHFHNGYWWLNGSISLILSQIPNSVAYFDPEHNGAIDLGYVTSDGRHVFR